VLFQRELLIVFLHRKRTTWYDCRSAKIGKPCCCCLQCNAANHPEVYLLFLLIDARKIVTDIRGVREKDCFTFMQRTLRTRSRLPISFLKSKKDWWNAVMIGTIHTTWEHITQANQHQYGGVRMLMLALQNQIYLLTVNVEIGGSLSIAVNCTY
jgi:hypothetical protein